MLYRFVMGSALAAAIASAAAAQDLPKAQFKVIGLNSPTPVSIHDEVPFWRKTIPEASKGAITADITPLDQMGIDDKTMLRLLEARRDGFRRHGHLQDGRRRSALRGLRPRRPDARSRQGARRLQRLSRRDRPADAEELGREAARLRRQHAAGVLVPRRRQRARRLQGQEGPRLQQHHARFPRRRRRDRGQHGLRRGGAGAQQRRRRLRRDRQPVGQHRRAGTR